MCPFCKKPRIDENAVLVNLQGTLVEVCDICWERAQDERQRERDDDAD